MYKVGDKVKIIGHYSWGSGYNQMCSGVVKHIGSIATVTGVTRGSVELSVAGCYDTCILMNRSVVPAGEQQLEFAFMHEGLTG